MNTVSRTITGTATVIFGIVVAAATLADAAAPSVLGVVIGVACVGLGVYIFFNTREDDIEDVTDTTHINNK